MAKIIADDGGNFNGKLKFQVAHGTGTSGNTSALSDTLILDDDYSAYFQGILKGPSNILSVHDRLKIANGGVQLNIGQWDTANHRIEGDSNRPMFLTSYNSGGIKLGVSGGVTATVTSTALDLAAGKNLNITDANLNVDEGSINQSTCISRPGKGHGGWSESGTTTGRIQIKLPGTTSNTGMVVLRIMVYEYLSTDGGSTTYTVGGHNWNESNASHGWIQHGAQKVGPCKKPLHLAIHGSRYCVLIGDANSVWKYGQVRVEYIQNGSYYSGNMNVGGDFEVTGTATISADDIALTNTDRTQDMLDNGI